MMSIPQINVSFIKTASTFLSRSSKGTLALIVRDAGVTAGLYTLYSEADINSGLSTPNADYIKRGFIGEESKPSKVILLVISTNASIENELSKLQNVQFDYLAGPHTLSETDSGKIAGWIKTERERGHYVKAVLPKTAADYEGVINFANEDIYVGETKYSPAQYCSRIAGLLCGTPITRSATYSVLEEVTATDTYSASELSTAVDAGKFLIFDDGEKIKVLAGITSLASSTAIQDFKKIKIVEAADMIRRDIRKTAEDRYIGKLANTYDNKCVLITAIDTYFRELIREGILSGDTNISIDIDAQRQYLISKGVDVDSMSEQEIKEAPTGEYVFLKSNAGIMDAIENISLNITI